MGGDSPVEEFYRDKVSFGISFVFLETFAKGPFMDSLSRWFSSLEGLASLGKFFWRNSSG